MTDQDTVITTPSFTLTLVDPVVEVPLLAKELSGKAEKLIVGFVRVSVEEGNWLREILDLSAKIHSPYNDTEKQNKAEYEQEALEKMKHVPTLRGLDYVPEEKELICKMVRYVRETHLKIDGKLRKIDTREFPDEFLQSLLASYMNHPIFYQVLARGLVTSWNAIASEAGVISMDEIKN